MARAQVHCAQPPAIARRSFPLVSYQGGAAHQPLPHTHLFSARRLQRPPRLPYWAPTGSWRCAALLISLASPHAVANLLLVCPTELHFTQAALRLSFGPRYDQPSSVWSVCLLCDSLFIPQQPSAHPFNSSLVRVTPRLPWTYTAPLVSLPRERRNTNRFSTSPLTNLVPEPILVFPQHLSSRHCVADGPHIAASHNLGGHGLASLGRAVIPIPEVSRFLRGRDWHLVIYTYYWRPHSYTSPRTGLFALPLSRAITILSKSIQRCRKNHQYHASQRPSHAEGSNPALEELTPSLQVFRATSHQVRPGRWATSSVPRHRTSRCLPILRGGCLFLRR